MSHEKLKVRLVYSKNLSDKTGASTVMRLIKRSTPLFIDENIDLNILSREDMIGVIQNDGNSRRPSSSIKGRFVKKLADLARVHPIAAFVLSYIQSMRPAKKMSIFAGYQIEHDEILFFNELFTAYYYLKKHKKNNSIVLVIHTDGEDFKTEEDRYKNFKGSLYNRFLIKMLTFVISKVDMIGFVSKRSASRFIELHPEFDSRNVFYAHNGLPVIEKPFRIQSSITRIICVGTVIESKGQHLIVEAIMKAVKNGIDLSTVHFIMLGDGPQLEILKDKVNDNNLNDYIEFLGATSNVDEYLQKSDIFILPSSSEGLPMSILEAMRMGLPIVSTPVGGIPETIIEGKTGFLIEPSIDGVYGFICTINEHNWQQMGAESYDYFMKEFTINEMVKSYSSVFKNLR